MQAVRLVRPGTPRIAHRHRVTMTAGFRESGIHKATVNVFDLSTTGFRIETFMGVRPDAKVWLTLPGLEAQAAKVMWVDGDFVGCMFDRPLHEAVLEMVARHRLSRA